MTSLRNRAPDIAALCLIYLWIGFYSYPYLAHTLSDNVRQIQTYNLDSGDAFNAVKSTLHDRLFHIRFNDYGHFYYNLSVLVALICSAFFHVSDWALFLILRLNAVIGGCFALTITYLFAARFLGRAEALFAGVVMAFSPAFMAYIHEAKPDSWQVYFLVLSLYFLARAFERPDGRALAPADFGFVLAASAAAGAAFGTKYLGMFLLPLIGAAALAVPPRAIPAPLYARAARLWRFAAIPVALVLLAVAAIADTPSVLRFVYLPTEVDPHSLFYRAIGVGRVLCALIAVAVLAVAGLRAASFSFAKYDTAIRRLFILAMTGIAFAAGFFATSPWMAWRFPFVRNIYLRNDLVALGGTFGWRWFDFLLSDATYAAHLTAAMALVGAALVLFALLRRDFRKPVTATAIILAFALIFLYLLVAKINRATVIYGLPLIPLIALLAAFALHEIARLAAPRWRVAGAAVLAVIVAVPQIAQGWAMMKTYPNLVTALSPDNQALSAWFLRCIPRNARILTASYSYVPPEFPNSLTAEGTFYYGQVHPNVVTVNLQVMGETLAAAKTGPVRPEMGQLQYYDMLMHAPEWKQGPTIGRFRIYVKPGEIRSPCL